MSAFEHLSSCDEQAGAPPVIGLTTYVEMTRHGAWDEQCAFVPHSYVEAVAQAGGCPVLLPPWRRGAGRALAIVDGLVLTGGPDVGPGLYGSVPHDETDAPREERDAWELVLCLAALGADLPLLAVCRGLQLLNVSLGGTLHQHLPEIVGHQAHRAVLGHASPNRVVLEPSSTVGSILGVETEGRCHHHQAVDRLGQRLQAVGFADDGTVEAVEVRGAGFAVGVQWHPEEDRADLRLFSAFVEAARGYAKERRAGPSLRRARTAARVPGED